MSHVKSPIARFLGMRVPGCTRYSPAELWSRIQSLQRSGEISRLVRAGPGEQGLTMGPTKRERLVYSFVEIGGTTSGTGRVPSGH
jgi:hypothetical protein